MIKASTSLLCYHTLSLILLWRMIWWIHQPRSTTVTRLGCHWEHQMPQKVAQKGTKVWHQSSGNTAQRPILACERATGQAIPPMVIFSGKHYDFSEGEVPDAVYGMSDSRWMDQDLLADFLKHVSGRPLLLFPLHIGADPNSHREEYCYFLSASTHHSQQSTPWYLRLWSFELQAYHDYMFRQFCHQTPVSSLKGMSIDNICAGFKTDFEELFRIHNHSWQLQGSSRRWVNVIRSWRWIGFICSWSIHTWTA